MGAVLACGDGAVLSHRSAAALWDLARDTRHTDVMSATRTGRRRPGLRVHRADTLVEGDVAEQRGIPCTSPARTLFDLASVADRRTLERAVDRAEGLRLFDLHALDDLLRRHPRRRGRATLASVLAMYSGSTITRSDAEEEMLALLDDAGLPRPRVNAWIAIPEGGGYEADFLWSRQRLIVEVDSRTHHATLQAFAHDRERDRRLAALGFETRRFAAAELRRSPRRVVAEIAGFLAQREHDDG
jgi:very-short-patch-repair endonuclease